MLRVYFALKVLRGIDHLRFQHSQLWRSAQSLEYLIGSLVRFGLFVSKISCIMVFGQVDSQVRLDYARQVLAVSQPCLI